MGDLVDLDQTRASSERRNESIDTSPPETSLSRLASPRDASLRPASKLRRCDSEQSAATATSATVVRFRSIHEAIGCDMDNVISGRNRKVNHEIFPAEISIPVKRLVKCGMGKGQTPKLRTIYLADWLRLFDLGASEAARIAGCDQSYISNISGGRKTNINALYLLALSEHMGITVNDLFHKPPPKSQIAHLREYSPQAQAALLGRKAIGE